MPWPGRSRGRRWPVNRPARGQQRIGGALHRIERQGVPCRRRSGPYGPADDRSGLERTCRSVRRAAS